MPRQPLTRNLAAEQDALRAALESPERGGAFSGAPGTDISKASPATQQLIREQVNTRVYGTARPIFRTEAEPAPVASPVSEIGQTATTPETPAPATPRPTLSFSTPTSTTTDLTFDPNVPKPRTYTEVRQEQLERAQAMIDASEAVFQEELGRLRKEGEARLSQTSSIAVGAGLAGSPFQQTRETEAQEYTNKVVGARESERRAEIAKLMAAAEGRATEQFDKEIARYQEERDFAVSEQERSILKQKTKQIAAKEKIAAIAAGGFSLGEFAPDEYQKFLADSGLSDFEVRALFASNSPEANATYTTHQNKLVQYYFDPRTKETKINTFDLPEDVEDGIEYDASTVQGQDGQTYLIYTPKSPMSLEDLQSNTLTIPVGGVAPDDTDAPTSYREWQLAGGEEGTGKTYGEWVSGKNLPKLPAGMAEDVVTMGTLEKMANDIETSGEEIGWAGVGGLWKGSIQSWLAKNFGTGTEEEQALRNGIGNITATIAKLRGGTSFTANEQKLLEQYTPTINDHPLVLKSKLDSLLGFIQDKRQITGQIYDLGNFDTGATGQTTGTPPPTDTRTLEDLRAQYETEGITDMTFDEALESRGEDWIRDLLPFNNDLGTSQKGQIISLNLGSHKVTVSQKIASALQQADAEYFKATGRHIPVSHSFRTHEEQAELYAKSQRGEIGRAAPPGESFHEKGLAVDVGNAWREVAPYLRKYGFRNDLPDDRGHFSIGEFT